jgi:hypothetical protein
LINKTILFSFVFIVSSINRFGYSVINISVQCISLSRLNRIFFILAIGILLAFGGTSYAQANTLKPFATDGCSMWIDGTPKHPHLWRGCCVAHDRAYWLGGTSEERRHADDQLRVCVNEKIGKGMAEYMYVNVLWGGSPYWLAPYRWGFGWEYLEDGKPRGYKTPTIDEQRQIDKLLPEAEKIILEDTARHQ